MNSVRLGFKTLGMTVPEIQNRTVEGQNSAPIEAQQQLFIDRVDDHDGWQSSIYNPVQITAMYRRENLKQTKATRAQGRGEAEAPWCPQSRGEAIFLSVVAFILLVFCIEVALFNHAESINASIRYLRSKIVDDSYHIDLPSHLLPHVPVLPPFHPIANADDHIANLLNGQASMVGVTAFLQNFISELHDSNMRAMNTNVDGEEVLHNFFDLAEKHIKPFDTVYHGKHIFPLREDGSIFISLAAFREGFLLETLVSAYKNAKNPDKVFVGAVVQNCFGKFLEDGTLDTRGKPCIGGKQVVGKTDKGKDIMENVPVPVDKNGIELFCALPDYAKYCKSGQVRVLYMHHTDGQGPSMARYYASKLWGGENYFMQIDSHLRFAHEWDAKYIADAKLTLNYPKSVLSAYPPGFEQLRFIPKHMHIDPKTVNNETVIESPGCRLCHCGTPKGKNPIIHINQSASYKGNETRPSQSPFLGAGLVFAHGNFLRDIPYDPYLPWTFMGEEILLSMRAWTNGWNMHAPRRNLIIHQYRPAKLGFPKFHLSVSTM